MIITDQFKNEWFALPKDLLLQYIDIVGVMGIALYAYLAANADQTYTCILRDSFLQFTLSVTDVELRETLLTLKDKRLISYEPSGISETKYTLLWHPSPIGKS